MQKKLLAAVILAVSCVTVRAQVQIQERGNMPPGDNVVGKVTAVGKDSLTVSPYASQLFQPMGGVGARGACASASGVLATTKAARIQAQKSAEGIVRKIIARRVARLRRIQLASRVSGGDSM